MTGSQEGTQEAPKQQNGCHLGTCKSHLRNRCASLRWVCGERAWLTALAPQQERRLQCLWRKCGLVPVGRLCARQGPTFSHYSQLIREREAEELSKGPNLTFCWKTPWREPNWCHGWFDDILPHSVFLFRLNPLQLSMGMLGFGFIATYLPEAAISAYLAATALHIIVSQLTFIFGIMISFHAGPISFFYVSNFYSQPKLQMPLPLPP